MTANQDQIEFWNGPQGDKWVMQAGQLDSMLQPFADAVLDAAELRAGERVMDIGCGTGRLSRMAAQKVGASGHVLGVDVSAPMLQAAEAATAQDGLTQLEFKTEDASQFIADPPVDAVISRFGVMFFEAPPQAFANLRQSAHADSRLVFACWQAVSANDWARAPLEAAMPLLTAPPEPPQPGAPGPFAFADPQHVEQILSTGGWQDIVISPWVGEIALPGENIDLSARFMLEMGPLSRLIKEQALDPDAVLDALKARFRSATDEQGRVNLKAAAWIVTAKA